MTKSRQEPKGPPVPTMQQFLKRMESELDERCKKMPSITPEMAMKVLNATKQMTTEEMLGFVEVINRKGSSNEKQSKYTKKLVDKLTRRLELSDNSPFNNDIDSTVKNQPKPQLPKALISNSKTSTTTHKMNAIAKSKNIKSRKKDFNKAVHSTHKKDTNTFKKDFFPSQEDTDSCFLKSLSMGTKTKTGLIVAMENSVINAANLVFQEHFKKKDFMWHRETLGDQVESFLNSQFEKEAEKLGDTKEVAEGIHSVHPDGFFCMQGYDRPIMICNYKTPDELTEEDCKWFDKYSKACQDANISAAEGFYCNSKLPEYENDPNLIKFKEFFQDVHSNTTKYGTECACVSSGRCLLFLLTPQDKLGTLKYDSIFVHDYESWKKAFETLLAILLNFSTDILEKKKPYEYGRFDERYQFFKESIISTKAKDTESKNENDNKNGSNNDKDDKDDEDKDNKALLKTCLSLLQSQKKQLSGSNGVKNGMLIRLDFKNHTISTSLVNNSNDQQQHIKNESKEITVQKDDSKQILEMLGFNNKTNKPTKSVELLKNCHPPLAKCCTQKCILSLKNNSPMNKKCPNYRVHKKNSYTNNNLHPVTYDDLATIFHNQIKNSTDRIQSFDWKYGTRGYMTKVTVYPYGYTIAGKGNPFNHGNDGDDMKQESSVSKGLDDDLQGELIPLSLGFTDVGYYCYFPVSYEGEKKNPESSNKDFNRFEKIDKKA